MPAGSATPVLFSIHLELGDRRRAGGGVSLPSRIISPSPHCLPTARGANPGRTSYTSSHQTSTGSRILKGDKKNGKKDKGEENKVRNPFGIGAPANTDFTFNEITAQFCKSLTSCPGPDATITTDVSLMSNLDCANSFTLDGAKLNGNGFTIKLGGNTINLQNGAKLEGVDLVGSGVAVTFLGGGRYGGECEHHGHAQ